MTREIYALDVETASVDSRHAAYAGLEPWRQWKKTGHITSASVCKPDGSVISLHRRAMGDGHFENGIHNLLKELEGKIVYGQNTAFDVAWLLGTEKETRTALVPNTIRHIKWFDTMLLAKWLINGQQADDLRFSLSLSNLIESFLPDHPLMEEFVRMKAMNVKPGENPEYWERRNALDVTFTRILAEFLEEKLPANQRMGYATEMRNIIPVANSWVTGIRVNEERLVEVEFNFVKEQKEIIERINIYPAVMTSPKQLAHLLFKELQIPPESFTPTGNPSTNADDLKMIAFKLAQAGQDKLSKFVKDISRYKQISTLMSKYVNGAKNALEHTEDGYIYAAARIFGTYTGRYTYSSKTLDTFQFSLALHQIPRKDKDIRSCLVPPEGHLGYEADASGQESRLMAIQSGDETLLRIFTDGINFHTMTASGIVGRDYDELQKEVDAGNLKAIEHRQMGKLTNLSCNYRIGGEALAKKAFDEYDIQMTADTGFFITNSFKRMYPGVPRYWDASIRFARANGYTEALGGRRYKLTDWSGKRIWQTESTALMTPIQGSGASMKNIAIAETFDKVSDAHFALDLHDASFFWVPEDKAKEVARQIDEVLENIDYKTYWAREIPIKLPYESKIGKTFADLK
jgi:DNA polymerase I-like protein with 3'-5' exonuclease and polymerase domains